MSREAESTSALIERMRAFEADHVPDGWPCIRMRDITALCDAVEAARAAALEEAAGYARGLRDAVRELAACRERFDKAAAVFEREQDRADAAEVRAETELAASREREARMRALIADDGYAMTFQSLGQYRTALLRELAEGAQG